MSKPKDPTPEWFEQERARSRARYHANIEKERARAAAYYAAHTEAHRARMDEWRKDHLEQHRAMCRAGVRQWRRDHPEKVEARAKARRALKRGAAGAERFSTLEIAERDDWTCHICEEPVAREDWSIDHLVPLSFGGEHTRANVKLAHHSCNASRGNRDLSYLDAA